MKKTDEGKTKAAKTTPAAKKRKPAAKKAKERKDHVLQARVPRSLYKELFDKAQDLRVPVSNLVRNILEDSFRMVENIVDGGIEITQALSGRPQKADWSSALGWQPMIANRDISCAKCGGPIQKGTQAFLGVGSPSGKNFVICGECQCRL